MFFLCVIFVLYKKGFWEFKEVTLKFKEVTQDSLQNDPWGFSGAQKYDHNFDYIDLFWWFFFGKRCLFTKWVLSVSSTYVPLQNGMGQPSGVEHTQLVETHFWVPPWGLYKMPPPRPQGANWQGDPMLVIRCCVINNDNLPFTSIYHVSFLPLCFSSKDGKAWAFRGSSFEAVAFAPLGQGPPRCCGVLVYCYIYTLIYFGNRWDLRIVSMLQCCTT